MPRLSSKRAREQLPPLFQNVWGKVLDKLDDESGVNLLKSSKGL